MGKSSTFLAFIFAAVIVCKTFNYYSGDEKSALKINREIQKWLIGKRVISATSDSWGGYGMGLRQTDITIVAEIEEQ